MDKQQVTIVVVDDDAHVGTAVQQLLRSAGYDAFTFTSAEEFLASNRKDAIGCLIADVNLPGMTGVELVMRMKKSDANYPAVLITGRDDPATRELMHLAERVPRLHKPFTDDALFDAIERVTGG